MGAYFNIDTFPPPVIKQKIVKENKIKKIFFILSKLMKKGP